MRGGRNIRYRSTAPLIGGATGPIILRSALPIRGGIQEFRNERRSSAHRNRAEEANPRRLRKPAATRGSNGAFRSNVLRRQSEGSRHPGLQTGATGGNGR